LGNAETPREKAAAEIIAAYESEFDRLEDTWKGLETKAQGTITVAGVFIGFVLAFAKDLSTTTPSAAVFA